MDYYVFKNNEQLGPFALMDVRERLKNGVFAYEDLAWGEGMADWTPLKEILGGALPDATPHSVSESTPARTSGPAAAPAVPRLVTSIVVFVIAFAVVAVAAWAVGSFIWGVVVAAKMAFSQHTQDTSAYLQAAKDACQSFFWVIATGAAVFSLVLSPVIAWLTAYSNLFPWCRAR